MTETEPQVEGAQTDEADEPVGPSTVYCRHCGQPNEINLEETPDWQCPACERYQDSTACPTCGSVVRISLLPPEMAPPVHEPTRRRRAKE